MIETNVFNDIVAVATFKVDRTKAKQVIKEVESGLTEKDEYYDLKVSLPIQLHEVEFFQRRYKAESFCIEGLIMTKVMHWIAELVKNKTYDTTLGEWYS